MKIEKDIVKNSILQNILLLIITVFIILFVSELALRIHRGQVFRFKTFIKTKSGRMVYDQILGWLPKTAKFKSGWTSNIDSSGFRSNGISIKTKGKPILVVGDSFAFGDEVEDNQTWSSFLENILKCPVLNAGVGAYGIDQAFLRAEILLKKYNPDVVILAFISNDINRTEYSYYPHGRGWKPYFKLNNNKLLLQNVPVPTKYSPRKFQTLRHILGYSLFADFILSRITPAWWHDFPITKKVDFDGEKICIALLDSLNRFVKKRGGKFIGISLATNGRIGGNERLPGLIKGAQDKGVDILDLSSEMLKLPSEQFQNLFEPSGHYSPAMNRWVAEHIADYLVETGIKKP